VRERECLPDHPYALVATHVSDEALEVRDQHCIEQIQRGLSIATRATPASTVTRIAVPA
jgi:hypothetical protein